MKILVVDDNRDDRMLLRLVIERQGHEPIEAENGQQGFELAAAHRPDLIISDALMPVLDGFHFLKKLKEDAVLRTIPFIFYSATYKADMDLALAASLGADAYIFKPKEPAALWGEVEATLARGGNLKTVATGVTDLEYLKKYSSMVATKLEEKVAELEKALTARAETEKALLRSKEDWERTFEAIGDIAMILDRELRISRANRQAMALLAAPGEDLAGKYCYQVFRGVDSPCEGCPALLAGKDIAIHTAEIEHKGLGRIFQVSASPIVDGQGGITGIVHFAKDITEQKELQVRLNQAQKLESIGTLAGGIAHDFNNILTPILGYAEMAKMDVALDSPAQEKLDEVIKAGMRAKDLVRQILTFSRRKEQERLPVEPHLIVKEAIKLLRSSIPTTIEIRQEIDPASGLVLADPTQLHQIIMNLCTNAYHAMRERGGILAIGLRTAEIDPADPKVNGMALYPGSYVLLEVSDTGQGMSKETMAKIFDPYFTTKKPGEGTGLGLSVVHGIVKSCGGHVSAYSEPGKGATFRVYLPRLADSSVEAGPAPVRSLPQGSENVLLVDDDNIVMKMETQMLTHLGYRTTALADSREALRRFVESPAAFDLVITDMTMPELTGIDLSQQIHDLRPDIPIILCTGFSELIDGDKTKGMGIQEFVMKPILITELAKVVRKVLDRR